MELRRSRSEGIPEAVRADVIALCRHLAEDYPSLFTHSRAKHSLVRLFEAQLPRQSRGFETVSRAIALRSELRRMHPEWSHKEIWRAIYSHVLSEHQTLSAETRNELRQRVRWRLEIRRRRQRARQKQFSSVL